MKGPSLFLFWVDGSDWSTAKAQYTRLDIYLFFTYRFKVWMGAEALSEGLVCGCKHSSALDSHREAKS